MAHTIETQTIVDNKRETVVKVHIHGDGASADLDNVLIVDASALSADEFKLMRIQATLSGFTAFLSWQANTPIHMYNIADYDVDQDFGHFDGIPNNAGTGKNGDILVSTAGLVSGHGHFILTLKKDPV